MKNLFPGYYQLTDAEFKTLWDEGTFVFDTSALLNLYRYPTAARDQLLDHIERIRERIWIPFHTALEFQRNRLAVIAEQMRKFSDVRKAADGVVTGLATELQNLQVRKRHSLIEVDSFLRDVTAAVDKFKKELSERENQQQHVNSEDSLRTRIELLFESKVGPEPKDQKHLKALLEHAEDRFNQQTPPGYRDASKEKKGSEDPSHFTFGEFTYERKFGDLLIWKQLIEYCNEAKLTKIVFVTDDEKDDWWWIVDQLGKKTIGPRPELTQELRLKAGVQLFHMYNSESFLQFASKHFQTSLGEDVLKQVEEAKHSAVYDNDIAATFKRKRLEERQILDAACDWIRRVHEGRLHFCTKDRKVVDVYDSDRKTRYVIMVLISGSQNIEALTGNMSRAKSWASETVDLTIPLFVATDEVSGASCKAFVKSFTMQTRELAQPIILNAERTIDGLLIARSGCW